MLTDKFFPKKRHGKSSSSHLTVSIHEGNPDERTPAVYWPELRLMVI